MDVKIAPFKCEKGIAQADKGVVPGHTGSAGIQGRQCGTVPAFPLWEGHCFVLVLWERSGRWAWVVAAWPCLPTTQGEQVSLLGTNAR